MNSNYDYNSHKISPIKVSSPLEEDSKMIDMFYRSKQNSDEKGYNQDEYGITKILSSKIDDKSLGNSYNSLLFFKTTDEGQTKMYNSYDYFDDLIKGSKVSKFMPLTKKQNVSEFVPRKNIIAHATGSISKLHHIDQNKSKVQEQFDKTLESRYSKKNYRKEIQTYFQVKNLSKS